MTDINHLAQAISIIFSSTFKLDVPFLDADLIEEGLMDSLLLVQLIMSLEERFGITIQLEDLEFDNLKTVRRIATLVASRLHDIQRVEIVRDPQAKVVG